MGFFDSVKKVVGTVADVAQAASPVIDVFVPGAGQVVNTVGGALDNAGVKGASKELGSLGDIGGTISGVLGGGANAVTSVLPFLQPNLGGTADRIYDQGVGAANQVRVDAIKGLEQTQYEQALAAYNANQANASARAAAANANNAARASAARQTEANRQRALRKANRQRKNYFNQGTSYLNPYVQAGQSVLPFHTQAVANANTLGNELMGKLLGGLPRRGLTTPGLMPLPFSMQPIADGAINQLTPVQTIPQQLAPSIEVAQEAPAAEIPQKFSDIQLTQRQKKRLKGMSKEERRIAKQHMLAKAQGKEVNRTLREKFNRLNKPQRNSRGTKIPSSTSNQRVVPLPRPILVG